MFPSPLILNIFWERKCKDNGDRVVGCTFEYIKILSVCLRFRYWSKVLFSYAGFLIILCHFQALHYIFLGISYLLLSAQHLIPGNISSKDFFPLQWFQSILLAMWAWPYVSSGCPLPATVFALVIIFKIRDISWRLAFCFASGISGRFCLFCLIFFLFLHNTISN